MSSFVYSARKTNNQLLQLLSKLSHIMKNKECKFAYASQCCTYYYLQPIDDAFNVNLELEVSYPSY